MKERQREGRGGGREGRSESHLQSPPAGVAEQELRSQHAVHLTLTDGTVGAVGEPLKCARPAALHHQPACEWRLPDGNDPQRGGHVNHLGAAGGAALTGDAPPHGVPDIEGGGRRTSALPQYFTGGSFMSAPSEVGSSGASLGETLSVVEECDLEEDEEEEEEEEEREEYEWKEENDEEDEMEEEEDASENDDENEDGNPKKKIALDESTYL